MTADQNTEMINNFMQMMNRAAKDNQCKLPCVLSYDWIAPSLGDIATQDSILDLHGSMTDDDKRALMEHLPEGQRTEEGLLQNLTSP